MRAFIRRHWAHVIGWVAVITLVTTLGVADALPGQNTVNSRDIINGEVKSVDVQNGGIRTLDLANRAVSAPKIGPDAVSSAKVADESLTGADLQDGSVGNSDLGDGQVNSAKVQNDSLTGSDIKNGALTGADVQNNSLGGIDIAENSLSGSQIPFGCSQPGIANFWAHVNGDATFASNTWYAGGSTQVPSYWNCSTTATTGVQVKKVGNATFDIYMQNSGGPWVIQATAFYDAGAGDDCRGAYVTVQRLQTNIYRYQVINADGLLENCPFAVTYF